jgi:hypothetical protein
MAMSKNYADPKEWAMAQQAAQQTEYLGSTKLPNVRKESPVNAARAALKQSHELSSYVHAIVNRLCGTQPEDAGYATGDGPSNGILFDIESEANDASRTMQGAMNALNRLESLLP